MFDLHRNDQVYTMVAEGEIAQLLSQFSDAYVMDVIDNSLANRFDYNPVSAKPNIVASFEMNFKDMLNRFPNDADNTISVRHETYQTIINKICDTYGLQYVGNDPDLFSIAYNLYDFLVSGYARNIITFFSRYIYANKDVLYSNMGLERYKKSKDSATSYIKKQYNDPIVATVIARTKDVIYYISGFDIPIYQFLTTVYDPGIANYIAQSIQPTGITNLFKDEFCAKVLETPSLMTEIRAAIQQMMEADLNQKEFYDAVSSIDTSDMAKDILADTGEEGDEPQQ
jgi:hypothetical protein